MIITYKRFLMKIDRGFVIMMYIRKVEVGGKNQLKIVRVEERNSVLIQELVDVWESSVQATHLFLLNPYLHSEPVNSIIDVR